MGLFSFLKKAGKKLTGRSEPEMTPEQIRDARIQALRNEISEPELPIQDMNIQLEEDSIRVSGTAENQAAREKTILALGNIEGIATVYDSIVVEADEPEAVFYEVKSGDSLSKIAKEHYGDAMKYPMIFEANKPMLKDPNLIYPGQVLRIPPLDEN